MTDDEKELAMRCSNYEIAREPDYNVDVWIRNRCRAAFVSGFSAGLDSLQTRIANYERLLEDVLDLPQIQEGHPRGIKTLIRAALERKSTS